MIKIAVVEDEHTYAMQLQEYLHQYEKECGEVFEITTFLDGDEIVSKYKSQFDIILMDIEMKFMDGMSAAEEIRKVDAEVIIIFVTNASQYAIRGYAVDALDYVLKPVSYFAFSQRIGRAIGRIKKRVSKTISVNIRGGVMKVDVADVYYIESRGHTLLFYLPSGIHEAVGTMKELEEELKAYNFFRGNKGYLINLAHVEKVVDNYAIVREQQVLLSRARKKAFMEALTRYWGEVRK